MPERERCVWEKSDDVLRKGGRPCWAATGYWELWFGKIIEDGLHLGDLFFLGVYNVLGQLFDCFIFGVNQDGIGHVHRHLVVEHHPPGKSFV